MSNYSDAILGAIDIVVQDRLNGLSLDKTVQGEIVSIVDMDTGEYRAKYNGNIITIFSRVPSEQYKIGERVYIVVPENDFSKDKIIFGRVERQSLSDNNSSELANAIIEASPTFDELYGYNASAQYGVVAGAPIGSSYRTSLIGSWSRSEYHGLFQHYADSYDYLRIQADFSTAFQSVHTIGNYGLELTFYTTDNSTISYRLDLSAFNGDPYRLTSSTPQFIILQVQRNYLYGLASIVLFEEDFEYDEYLTNGLPSGEYNTDTPNIFVKNISIQYVDRTDLSADTYYLAIATERGDSFTSTVRSLTLEGKVIFQSNNVYNDSICTCKWFVQDPSIEVGSDDYDRDAGVGWAPLSETSNKLTLTISSGEVWYHKKYKLVVTYNSRTLLFAEQNIYNLIASIQDISLQQTTENDSFSLQIINNSTSEVLLGQWYILYPDGKYAQLANGQKRNNISIEDYLIYTSAVIYCVVYRANGTTYLDVLENGVTSSSLESDVTVTYQGEDTFRYDANGDIAVEDSEKERYLKPIITWKEGIYGTGTKVQWYDINGTYLAPGGAQISYDSSYQSLINDLYVDNNNVLHYHIRQKYKDYYNNNTLTLKIITAGNEYIFKKEILFLKDGDQGTNGTSYICAIRPCEVDGTKASGYRPLTYNGGWTNSVRLKCFVYHDGEPLDNTYTVEYEWESSSTLSLTSTNTAQTVTNGRSTLAAARYVKCTVKVKDNINREYVWIHALYPIDVIVGGMTVSAIDLDIPQFIKYTASGLTPQYYNTAVRCLYGDASLNVRSLDLTLLTIDDEQRLKPSPNFNFEDNTIGLLRCDYTNSQYILHSVVMYLNTYGNEAINAWDGTSIETTNGRILAPQVGAGEKDPQSRLFTGVVMGKDTAQSLIGLYGYQAGVNTFGLRQDGVAYFGRSGLGRIIVNGTSATIYGGACSPTNINGTPSPADNGMIIRLSNTSETGGTHAINIGNSKFYVTYNGVMHCTGAQVNGRIEATEGWIGGSSGWVIASGQIKSTNGTVQLNSNSSVYTYAIQAGSNFYVDFRGNLTASGAKLTSADVSGKITATSGTIGGWTINSTTLTGGNTTLNSNGTISTDIFVINNYGRIGYVSTSQSGSGIGIAGLGATIVEGTGNTRLSSSGGNVFVQANNGTVNLLGGRLYCSVPASNQSGIYARFA